MGVVRAKIQTVEDMYRLIRAAVTARQPVSAVYEQRPRLVCPHRLGHNSAGQARVLCYQYGGESSTGLEPSGSSANWRCMKLEKFSRVELLEGIWHTAPTIPGRRPALRKSMWTPKTIRTAIRKPGIEGGRRPTGAPWWSGAW
jgi:hypothetical protein